MQAWLEVKAGAHRQQCLPGRCCVSGKSSLALSLWLRHCLLELSSCRRRSTVSRGGKASGCGSLIHPRLRVVRVSGIVKDPWDPKASQSQKGSPWSVCIGMKTLSQGLPAFCSLCLWMSQAEAVLALPRALRCHRGRLRWCSCACACCSIARALRPCLC